MGTRGNVIFRDTSGPPLFMYQHWDAYNLPTTVANALDRGRDRWTDGQYLARIIFSEMIRDDVLDTTGYGLSTYEGDGGVTVEVDVASQTVNGKPFEEFIKRELGE